MSGSFFVLSSRNSAFFSINCLSSIPTRSRTLFDLEARSLKLVKKSSPFLPPLNSNILNDSFRSLAVSNTLLRHVSLYWSVTSFLSSGIFPSYALYCFSKLLILSAFSASKTLILIFSSASNRPVLILPVLASISSSEIVSLIASLSFSGSLTGVSFNIVI